MSNDPDFDDLLQRYLNNDVTGAEKAKIDAWLELNKSSASDLNLSPEEQQALYRKITRKINDPNLPGTATPVYKRPLFYKLILPVSASIFVLTLIAYAAFFFLNPAPDKEKLILADGSLIWMTPGARFAYFEKGDSARYAQLSGEALFEVAKDPTRPFIITTGNYRVSVLGTSFTLKADDHTLELLVLTGSVNVSSDVHEVNITLGPHERFSATNGITHSEKIPDLALPEVVKGTEYTMDFHNTPLQEVITRIEKKFDVAITLSDSRAALCRITADVTDHGLDSTLTVLTDILNISYERQQNTITLNGSGCTQ